MIWALVAPAPLLRNFVVEGEVLLGFAFFDIFCGGEFMKAFQNKGFTLIELMITVTIIGILAGLAIQAYQNYVASAADKSCLAEAKAYAQVVLVRLNGGEAAPAHNSSSCSQIATPTILSSFSTTAVSPGSATITCDLAVGVSCSL